MSTIAVILAHKKNDVLTISASATVFEVIAMMVKRNVGSILVTDEADSILGIFTERDYLRRIVLESRTSKTTLVSEVMSRNLVYTNPSCSVEECMNTMTDKRIRHIPVIEDGRLAGIVSIGDLAKHLCEERRSEVKNLTDYITGQYPGEVGARHPIAVARMTDQNVRGTDREPVKVKKTAKPADDWENEGGATAAPSQRGRQSNQSSRSASPILSQFAGTRRFCVDDLFK